jgi:hypothetical protein
LINDDATSFHVDPSSFETLLKEDIFLRHGTDYIGFRCAMSRVGPKVDKRKTPRN